MFTTLQEWKDQIVRRLVNIKEAIRDFIEGLFKASVQVVTIPVHTFSEAFSLIRSLQGTKRGFIAKTGIAITIILVVLVYTVIAVILTPALYTVIAFFEILRIVYLVCQFAVSCFVFWPIKRFFRMLGQAIYTQDEYADLFAVDGEYEPVST